MALHTSTGGQNRLSDGKVGATGDKLKTGAITWGFANLRCAAIEGFRQGAEACVCTFSVVFARPGCSFACLLLILLRLQLRIAELCGISTKQTVQLYCVSRTLRLANSTVSAASLATLADNREKFRAETVCWFVKVHLSFVC